MRAVAPGRERAGSEGVGVNGEGDRNGVVSGDAAEGVAVGHGHGEAVHRDGGHVITGVGGEGEGLAGAVVHRHHGGRIDGAVAPGRTGWE